MQRMVLTQNKGAYHATEGVNMEVSFSKNKPKRYIMPVTPLGEGVLWDAAWFSSTRLHSDNLAFYF